MELTGLVGKVGLKMHQPIQSIVLFPRALKWNWEVRFELCGCIIYACICYYMFNFIPSEDILWSLDIDERKWGEAKISCYTMLPQMQSTLTDIKI